MKKNRVVVVDRRNKLDKWESVATIAFVELKRGYDPDKGFYLYICYRALLYHYIIIILGRSKHTIVIHGVDSDQV